MYHSRSAATKRRQHAVVPRRQNPGTGRSSLCHSHPTTTTPIHTHLSYLFTMPHANKCQPTPHRKRCRTQNINRGIPRNIAKYGATQRSKIKDWAKRKEKRKKKKEKRKKKKEKRKNAETNCKRKRLKEIKNKKMKRKDI